MGRLGTTEIIFILLIILLFFGGKKIPELIKGLGNGIKEFKSASKDSEIKNPTEQEENLKN